MSTTFTKDPHAKLDYKFDWAPATNQHGGTDWLSASEIITSACLTATGVVISNSSIADTNTSVLFYASGGTAGCSYRVSCRIETNSNPARDDERSLILKIEER